MSDWIPACCRPVCPARLSVSLALTFPPACRTLQIGRLGQTGNLDIDHAGWLRRKLGRTHWNSDGSPITMSQVVETEVMGWLKLDAAEDLTNMVNELEADRKSKRANVAQARPPLAFLRVCLLTFSCIAFTCVMCVSCTQDAKPREDTPRPGSAPAGAFDLDFTPEPGEWGMNLDGVLDAMARGSGCDAPDPCEPTDKTESPSTDGLVLERLGGYAPDLTASTVRGYLHYLKCLNIHLEAALDGRAEGAVESAGRFIDAALRTREAAEHIVAWLDANPIVVD